MAIWKGPIMPHCSIAYLVFTIWTGFSFSRDSWLACSWPTSTHKARFVRSVLDKAIGTKWQFQQSLQVIIPMSKPWKMWQNGNPPNICTDCAKTICAKRLISNKPHSLVVLLMLYSFSCKPELCPLLDIFRQHKQQQNVSLVFFKFLYKAACKGRQSELLSVLEKHVLHKLPCCQDAGHCCAFSAARLCECAGHGYLSWTSPWHCMILYVCCCSTVGRYVCLGVKVLYKILYRYMCTYMHVYVRKNIARMKVCETACLYVLVCMVFFLHVCVCIMYMHAYVYL